MRASWNLAKAKKPFTDAELIRMRAIDIVEEVLSHDKKTKKMPIDLLSTVSLSDITAVTRVEVLAEQCLSALHCPLMYRKLRSFSSPLTHLRVH